jgi:LPS-assembly lipoprotein
MKLGFAILPLVLLLTGCGFHPLYGTQSGPRATTFAAMSEIDIGLIPNRSGQILREALEADLQRNGAPDFYRYHLNVQQSISVQAIGIQPDSSNSAVRYFETMSWSLVPEGNRSLPLATGTAEATDSVNQVDNQFFALSLQSNKLQHYLARELAAQATQELAIYFRKHPAP